MLFESLSDKLAAVFKKLKGHGKLSPDDIKAAMREVKLALLEADVNFKVVKEFISKVSERAVGAEVLESLTPAQQVIKIVNDELCAIMGSHESKLTVSPKPPTIIMFCGLQGAGKTTHCAKLANFLKKDNRRVLLCACDIYRPAAITQLEILGEKIGTPVFKMPDGTKPPVIAKEALKFANQKGYDTLIIDTAGRLHIDEQLMEELSEIKKEVNPAEILLTVDAMTGQDAVTVAESFDKQLDITGVVLTKSDGDTRGGAALSVKYVTGKPIKFVGTGEKITDIEVFHPDRMAQRILGMGDILSLAEKAQEVYDEKKAAELEKKIREQSFDMADFLDQLKQIRKMGPISQFLGMIPGLKPGQIKEGDIDEKQLDRTEAIIKSMTAKERAKPEILNGSRKQRIAKGSGTSVEEINRLIKQFDQMKQMMKMMRGGKMPKGMGFPGM